MHPTPHLSPTSELHSIPYAAAQPDPLRGEDELAAAELGAAEATDVTRRLAIVLEAIRTAGFQDFDDTAVAYYTARLDKGSFPAMVQCASRGRRLKTMLQTVQRSSQQWLRWESQGLQESICKGSATLCVAELNRFSNRSVQVCGENEPASLITALESLLSSHKVGMFGETGIQSLTPPEESGLLEQMENAPDLMPFLWSLLTEFAGTRSVYCDRVARLILAILLYARSAQ
ncbi:uncharacterized protein NFIA_062240 [Aspergillus fischeri NRRL 181]|uniref:Uncharacterized protein n=1 Tax=Neosartorya fischeri (strain ATCC 1020 / DSM 3700 / CBS 544.65 / FGSC A1164 / JCM 1740 / NRRL 181 / WB 181) TaxID=331117 RepID=A1D5R9_NEOFI|nr:uncharacterized protein NFIA_062240 [Aspergillus fischeri NRRL 181]EAW21063.1 hypothetical protein NFIA_062240 [Aspergillus fischeri NRRL 181]KAG2019270.1 hypothetical protein GB937_005184 [Aspergillus fischeri]